jgi:NADH:ubiquinone oxidoreductase subunit 6 (subunit J)
MPETVNGIAFAVLALMCVGGAIGMLVSKNIVHSAFWLLEVSIAAAGVFFILGSDYVALVQLLVYAVAVAVLMVFSIMITLRRPEDAIRTRDFSVLAAALAAAFAAVMIFLSRGFSVGGAQRMPAVAPGIPDIGALLFSVKGWSLPFEIASLVLVVALIGAVWWTKEGDD